MLLLLLLLRQSVLPACPLELLVPTVLATGGLVMVTAAADVATVDTDGRQVRTDFSLRLETLGACVEKTRA